MILGIMFFGVLCVTFREYTERPVMVKHWANVNAGTSVLRIREAIARHLSRRSQFCTPEKWEGKATHRIVSILAYAVYRCMCRREEWWIR